MDENQPDDCLIEAIRLIDVGDFDRARSLLLDVTADEQSSETWKLLGVAQNKLGDQGEAERCLLESLALNPSDADAWSSLGGVYIASERYGDALAAYESGMQAGNPATYALLNYLSTAAVLGKLGPALDRYRADLRIGRVACEAEIAKGINVPWCYYDLAQILILEGDVDSHRVPLREALRRSVDWQVKSARRSYELLAKSPVLAETAADILQEFDRSDDSSLHAFDA